MNFPITLRFSLVLLISLLEPHQTDPIKGKTDTGGCYIQSGESFILRLLVIAKMAFRNRKFLGIKKFMSVLSLVTSAVLAVFPPDITPEYMSKLENQKVSTF